MRFTPYHPLTAQPFRHDSGYAEFAPCDALKPYVRCFWVSERNTLGSGLVIPDSCTDIILTFHADGSAPDAVFCGPDDRPSAGFAALQPERFAIRFYAWTTAAFTRETMCALRNERIPAEAMFPRIHETLALPLQRARGLRERITLSEAWLLDRLRPERIPTLVLSAVEAMLDCGGSLRVSDLGRAVHLSSRQLERVFAGSVGISPKQLCRVIRYQHVWHAALAPGFHPVEEAVRLGFYDQSHLLHEFTLMHGESLSHALLRAGSSLDSG